jgi:hypothetical protein
MTWTLFKPTGWGTEHYDDFPCYDDAVAYLANEGFTAAGFKGRAERWTRGEVVLLLREVGHDLAELRNAIFERNQDERNAR